ncbi:MAG: hypothetical protein AUK37_03160 [Rhodobacterales bacterium CG2_30_65_12]|nr:MAG: hypothetical protein AUK37_03160 [Rhodobacterales bacterium CG2_30_65_12]
MSRTGAALLFAALAGCAAPGGLADRLGGPGATFIADANGLAVDGSSLRIDFGRAPSGVIAALDRELGKGRVLGVAGCPAGIADQRDWGGLVLSFTTERFVGWRREVSSAGETCAVTG